MAGRSKGVSTSDVGTRGEPGFPEVMTRTRGGVSGKLVFSRLSGLPPSAWPGNCRKAFIFSDPTGGADLQDTFLCRLPKLARQFTL